MWDLIRIETRMQDIRFQKSHSMLIKSMVPIILIMNTWMTTTTANFKMKQLCTLACDSFKLLSMVHSELVNKRKDVVKLDLRPQYRQLCNNNTAHTEWIFGDDLNKTIKDINEATQLGEKVGFKATNSKQR